MTEPIVKLHWLEKSRALRVVWLLDALNVKYDVVTYKRDKNYRAPDSLRKVHPLGRSPLLEVQQTPDSKPVVLAESGFIFQWVLNNFDKNNTLVSPQNKDQVDYYLHYAEGSLQPPLMLEFILQKASEAPIPWPLSYLSKTMCRKISQAYSFKESQSQLSFLEGELKKNNGYFVGGKLTAADIILSFPVSNAFRIHGLEKKDYPQISQWILKIESNPDYKKAQEREKSFSAE